MLFASDSSVYTFNNKLQLKKELKEIKGLVFNKQKAY
jgi:hypothetical protein